MQRQITLVELFEKANKTRLDRIIKAQLQIITTETDIADIAKVTAGVFYHTLSRDPVIYILLPLYMKVGGETHGLAILFSEGGSGVCVGIKHKRTPVCLELVPETVSKKWIRIPDQKFYRSKEDSDLWGFPAMAQASDFLTNPEPLFNVWVNKVDVVDKK